MFAEEELGRLLAGAAGTNAQSQRVRRAWIQQDAGRSGERTAVVGTTTVGHISSTSS